MPKSLRHRLLRNETTLHILRSQSYLAPCLCTSFAQHHSIIKVIHLRPMPDNCSMLEYTILSILQTGKYKYSERFNTRLTIATTPLFDTVNKLTTSYKSKNGKDNGEILIKYLVVWDYCPPDVNSKGAQKGCLSEESTYFFTPPSQGSHQEIPAVEKDVTFMITNKIDKWNKFSYILSSI